MTRFCAARSARFGQLVKRGEHALLAVLHVAEAGCIRGAGVALLERGEDRVMFLIRFAKRIALHQAVSPEQLELLDRAR